MLTPGRWQPLAALLGGVLWGACFGRHPGPFLPWVGLLPLVLLLGTERPGRLALLHGLATWLTGIYWLAPTLETYGDLPRALAILLLFVLVAYLALYHWAFAALGAPLWRRGGAAALVGLPAVWVGLEWLRTHLLSGFPWNLAAYAWVDMPGALPLGAFVGSYGLSFLLVLVSAALALSLRRRRYEPAALALLIALLGFAFGARFGPKPSRADVGRAVRLVQPNTPNLVEWQPAVVQENYARLLRLTSASCDASRPLLVWPESAAWPYDYERDDFLREDVARVVSGGCPLLLNSPRWQGERVYNSVLLAAAGGGLASYDKNHLVPYGEFVPFGELFPFIGRLARNAGDFSASSELALLPWHDERLGVAICFEIVFPGEVARRVRRGATLLVTITNDAWYGDTSAPWQHLRAAQFRAAENGRPLLRAAVTGISALIAADGSLVKTLGVDQEGVIAGRVEGRAELTLYSRAPWLIPSASVVVAVVTIWWQRRRVRAVPGTERSRQGAQDE